MEFKDMHLTDEEALQNFLIDIDCLDELRPWIGHFNLFDVLKISRVEIRHSNVLEWLLDPNENHGVGDAFLKAVIQEMVEKDSDGRYDVFQTLLLDFYSFTVYREWKDIDILLVSDQEHFLIAIENKIGAQEHNNQLNRYRKILDTDYPDYKKMLIFLTPDGDDPSDVENWDVLDYTTIAEILEKQMNLQDLLPDVELMVRNYLDVIRRDIVEDQKLIEVCNKIYTEHKKALDLIFEHRIDGRAQFVSNIRSELIRLAAEGLILFSGSTGAGPALVFHTKEMNQYLEPLNTAASSWGTNYIYQYWIRLQGNKLCGIFELGGLNVPDDSMETMRKMIDILKPADKRKETFKYKRLYRTKWYEFDEFEHVQDDITGSVRKIAGDLLKQEKELLDQLKAAEKA